MDISSRGLQMLYEFEGKHKKLPDGRYKAYRCPANVPTIYAGLTHGVKDGMILTEEEGEAMLRKELWRYEDAVERLVTVDINQNEFDGLTLLVFNIGVGAFEKSTLLKLLNQGKRQAAALQFHRWVNGGGKKLPGLVRRRAAEAALFLEPAEAPAVAGEAADEPTMPQKVEEVPVSSVKDVVASSWTLRGAALAALGTVTSAMQQGYEFVFGVAKEAGPEVLSLKTTLSPFDPLLKLTPALLTMLIMVGLGIVVARRINAAKEGKVG